jgi:DNA-binding NarL/FixJ family response regulator
LFSRLTEPSGRETRIYLMAASKKEELERIWGGAGMKVALLAASGLYTRQVENCLDVHPEAGVELVWAGTEPHSVLAALDHEPDLVLLDMRWRGEALEAAKLLKAAGVPLIICLFDRLDDPLQADARSIGLQTLFWDASDPGLVARIRAAG